MENVELEGIPLATCRNCGKSFLRTREGRLFCSDECRAAWHNRRRKPSERYRIKVSGALERNYRLLAILVSRGVASVCLHDPMMAGFRPDYMTSCVIRRKGKPLYYCFDIRYTLVDDEICCVEKIPGPEDEGRESLNH